MQIVNRSELRTIIQLRTQRSTGAAAAATSGGPHGCARGTVISVRDVCKPARGGVCVLYIYFFRCSSVGAAADAAPRSLSLADRRGVSLARALVRPFHSPRDRTGLEAPPSLRFRHRVSYSSGPIGSSVSSCPRSPAVHRVSGTVFFFLPYLHYYYCCYYRAPSQSRPTHDTPLSVVRSRSLPLRVDSLTHSLSLALCFSFHCSRAARLVRARASRRWLLLFSSRRVFTCVFPVTRPFRFLIFSDQEKSEKNQHSAPVRTGRVVAAAAAVIRTCSTADETTRQPCVVHTQRNNTHYSHVRRRRFSSRFRFAAVTTAS